MKSIESPASIAPQAAMKLIEPLALLVLLELFLLKVKTSVLSAQQDLSLISLDQLDANGAQQELMKPIEPLVLTVQQVPLLCLDHQVKAHAKLVQLALSLNSLVQVNANGVKQDLTKPTELLVLTVPQVPLL